MTVECLTSCPAGTWTSSWSFNLHLTEMFTNTTGQCQAPDETRCHYHNIKPGKNRLVLIRQPVKVHCDCFFLYSSEKATLSINQWWNQTENSQCGEMLMMITLTTVVFFKSLFVHQLIMMMFLLMFETTNLHSQKCLEAALSFIHISICGWVLSYNVAFCRIFILKVFGFAYLTSVAHWEPLG